MRRFGRMGTITDLSILDAPDLGSTLRDMTGSSDSKAAGPRNQRLCLVPHTCRFLWTAIVGCRTDSEGLKSSPHPLRGRPAEQVNLWFSPFCTFPDRGALGSENETTTAGLDIKTTKRRPSSVSNQWPLISDGAQSTVRSTLTASHRDRPLLY